MFRRKKAQEVVEEGVKAVCGYKDSRGRFWETYEKAVESTKETKRIEEEFEMVEEAISYVASKNKGLSTYSLRYIFRDHSKAIYDILHKHYGKEGL